MCSFRISVAKFHIIQIIIPACHIHNTHRTHSEEFYTILTIYTRIKEPRNPPHPSLLYETILFQNKRGALLKSNYE